MRQLWCHDGSDGNTCRVRGRGWIIPHDAADLTSRSLRKADATSASLRNEELEGHACHARSEGHVYRARGIGMDNPAWCNGRNKRVPPGGPDKQVPPRVDAEVGKLFDNHAASRYPKGPWSRFSQCVIMHKMELFMVSRKGFDNHECSQSPPCCRHRW
jgi:hypothetical protein